MSLFPRRDFQPSVNSGVNTQAREGLRQNIYYKLIFSPHLSTTPVARVTHLGPLFIVCWYDEVEKCIGPECTMKAPLGMRNANMLGAATICG